MNSHFGIQVPNLPENIQPCFSSKTWDTKHETMLAGTQCCLNFEVLHNINSRFPSWTCILVTSLALFSSSFKVSLAIFRR